jgi:predicted phosphodiesterase
MKTLKEYGLTERQLRMILNGRKPKIKIIKQQITEDELEFGVVSDTHLCSTHEKLNELHTIYAIFQKVGIKTVFHSGDLLCGWKVYNGQENEVKVFGADNQVKYVVDNYPYQEGITTYFITGNHDLAWLKLAGIDIGERIAEKRPDMKYLGQYQGDFILNGVKIRLFHGEGGGSYALSYKSQKVAEQIASGKKPQVMLFGHWHTSLYFFYRNIHILHCGAFEGQSLYLVRKGLNPSIGGWAIKMRTSKNKSLIAFNPGWIPFYGEEK